MQKPAKDRRAFFMNAFPVEAQRKHPVERITDKEGSMG
jgi:hypothetical protein